MVPLKGRTLADVATELANALIADGATLQPDRVEELLAAESLPRDVVPVGPQAFMLHFRTDAVTTIAVALGVAPEPVFRERDSTREARIIILILAPFGDTGAFEFLQAQGGFAHAFSRPEIIEGILAARKPDDVLAVAPLAEIVLPGNLIVRDVMARGVFSLRSNVTLGEAARLMTARDIAAAPVLNEAQEVVGMLSYRELLTQLLPGYVKRISGETPAGRGKPGLGTTKDPRTLPIKQVMDRSVFCVSEDQTLAEVASIMVNKDVDRLPVVREGALVGFITQGDIVRKLLGG